MQDSVLESLLEVLLSPGYKLRTAWGPSGTTPDDLISAVIHDNRSRRLLRLSWLHSQAAAGGWTGDCATFLHGLSGSTAISTTDDSSSLLIPDAEFRCFSSFGAWAHHHHCMHPACRGACGRQSCYMEHQRIGASAISNFSQEVGCGDVGLECVTCCVLFRLVGAMGGGCVPDYASDIVHHPAHAVMAEECTMRYCSSRMLNYQA
jgi:hypothetical protein